jgi:pimeloyl-ACP methyl ester carboxylesterase
MTEASGREQPIGRLQSRWTRVGKLSLHVKTGTDMAPAGRLPLVFVHGLLVSSRYMLAAAVRLAPQYPVYALDLPGYGQSSKPPATWPSFDLPGLSTVLRDWMDAVGLERIGFIANSFGCQIVTDFVLRYPSRAACLVLAGPTVDPHRHSVVQQMARLLLDATREPLKRYLRVILADLWDIGVPRAVRLARVTLHDHIEARLPRVAVPTLVVRGGRDPLVPQEWAEEAAALLPDGQLVVIPGYTHIVHVAAPDAFVAVVRPFLEAME